ncbi:MAG: SurA N-terminal domain-containing protein [Nitrospira sp.]|nr:SurA N-terminal domain-containing protein [Nitrospira sp.]
MLKDRLINFFTSCVLPITMVLGVSVGHAETPTPVPLAEVNGEALTVEDLDRSLGVKLTRLPEQIYSLKRAELDAQIAQRFLAQEANKRGMSVAVLLDAEVTAKVSLVTEIENSRCQANKANIKGEESEVRERICASLQQRKLSAQGEQFVRSLCEKGTVVDRH